jgi:hypothetical protein
VELSIESDKPSYDIGDVARFTVRADFEDGPAPDLWMRPTIWNIVDGQQVSPEKYPDYPMHESDDETQSVGWFVVPILRGRSGPFRAEAFVYEPERQPVDTASVDFQVNAP